MAGIFVPKAGDHLQCSMYMGQGAQLAINRLHYLVNAVAGPAQGSDLFAQAFLAALAPDYQVLMTKTGEVINAGVRRLLPAPQTEEDFANPGATLSGNVGTAPIPGQVSGIITKRTGLAGRANRGRVYVPFPDQASNEPGSNFPTAPYLVNLGALAAAIAGPITLSVAGTFYTLFLEIYHKKAGTFTLTTGTLARPRWATQRRRGNYGRTNTAPG